MNLKLLSLLPPEPLVLDANLGSIKKFITSHDILSEAMIELVQLYDWHVFDQSDTERGEKYVAELTVNLDKTKLPKAIQVDAIGSVNWNLVSEPYTWLPKDFNHKP